MAVVNMAMETHPELHLHLIRDLIATAVIIAAITMAIETEIETEKEIEMENQTIILIVNHIIIHTPNVESRNGLHDSQGGRSLYSTVCTLNKSDHVHTYTPFESGNKKEKENGRDLTESDRDGARESKSNNVLHWYHRGILLLLRFISISISSFLLYLRYRWRAHCNMFSSIFGPQTSIGLGQSGTVKLRCQAGKLYREGNTIKSDHRKGSLYFLKVSLAPNTPLIRVKHNPFSR